jgi:hypothetical protein
MSAEGLRQQSARANHRIYLGTGADRQQRPLRSRSRRRLTAGVDMTSDVKGCESLF